MIRGIRGGKNRRGKLVVCPGATPVFDLLSSHSDVRCWKAPLEDMKVWNFRKKDFFLKKVDESMERII